MCCSGHVLVLKLWLSIPGRLFNLSRTRAGCFRLILEVCCVLFCMCADDRSGNQPLGSKYLPVRAMLPLGSHMLASGGCVREGADPEHSLQLWDCRIRKSLREFACRCGPVTCLELLTDDMQPPSGIAHASVSSSRSSISEGDVGSGRYSMCYRLLSGHADGQVVLWELRGRGAGSELQELAVIGEYRKDR